MYKRIPLTDEDKDHLCTPRLWHQVPRRQLPFLSNHRLQRLTTWPDHILRNFSIYNGSNSVWRYQFHTNVSKSNSLKAQINMVFTMRVDNSKNFCSHSCPLCIHLCFTHYFHVYSLSNFELIEHQFNNHILTRKGCKSPQQQASEQEGSHLQTRSREYLEQLHYISVNSMC